MDSFGDILPADAVSCSLVANSKKALFSQLAGMAQRVAGIDPRHVLDRLNERERLGSTGFGGGVAIPHGKIDSIEQVVGLFARLPQPIEFDAIDGLPVDLVFLLLSPSGAGAEHLKALARVSRRFRDREFVTKLRGAGSEDALYALLAGHEARDAA